jgi:hypothetical protein
VKERTPTVVGLSILLLTVAAVSAVVFGPRSDKLKLSSPDIGTDPGIVQSNGSETVSGTQPVTGTTIAGVGPTFVTTTTTPFVLAGPTGAAATATTIAGPPPTFYSPGISATTTPTESGGAQAFPTPPPPKRQTPVCLAAFTVVSAYHNVQIIVINDPNTPNLTIRTFMADQIDGAVAALNQSALSPAETFVGPALADRLRITAAAYRNATTREQIVTGLLFTETLTTPKGPNEAAGWPDILAYLDSQCPEVLSTLPSPPKE